MISIISYSSYKNSGAFVDDDWGLSFVVPGLIIVGMGVVVWLFLVAKPEGLLIF
jgi:hypothetical protein